MNAMNETEASQKWCPFARVVHMGAPAESSSYNRAITRSGENLPRGACIASACMAWRWEVPLLEKRFVSKPYGYSDDGPYGRPEGDNWVVFENTNARTVWQRPWPNGRIGLCGLSEPRISEVAVSS